MRTRKRMCIHRASIVVSESTPRYYIPAAELPLHPSHPSTSVLVITVSARSFPAVYPLRLDCTLCSLAAELNSVRCEPREIS
jgi:hypothetical protein